MAKRVKKGFRQEYVSRRSGDHCLCLEERDGSLEVAIRFRGDVRSFVLPACDVEALGMTAVLEDVPEPWERVRDAAFACASVLECQAVGRHRLVMTDNDWRKVAEALGIKPEGES